MSLKITYRRVVSSIILLGNPHIVWISNPPAGSTAGEKDDSHILKYVSLVLVARPDLVERWDLGAASRIYTLFISFYDTCFLCALTH